MDKTDGFMYRFGDFMHSSKNFLSIRPGQVDFLAGNVFFKLTCLMGKASGRSSYKYIINYREAGNGPRKAECESCMNVEATQVRT